MTSDTINLGIIMEDLKVFLLAQKVQAMVVRDNFDIPGDEVNLSYAIGRLHMVEEILDFLSEKDNA